MGRTNFCRTGYGMTEQEAYQNALDQARSESGHQDGYSGDMNSACDGDMKTVCIRKPKIAKRCKVEKTVQKGTRKWQTVYVIEARFRRNDTYEVIKTSQADAMKKAKELALKTGDAMEVTIDKQLVDNTPRIAIVSPNNSQQGAWRFSGTARC